MAVVLVGVAVLAMLGMIKLVVVEVREPLLEGCILLNHCQLH